MGRYQTRLPTVEEERLIRAAAGQAVSGPLGAGGGGGGGSSGPGTLETLTDVSITPADGQLIYRRGADWVALGIPADWATQRYALGIAAGFPSWVPLADATLAIGWGYNWGNNWGGS